MTGETLIVFTRKPVVDETFIRNSSNEYKSIVGIDARQLYPFSICQNMQHDCTGDEKFTPICRNLRLDITVFTTLRV